MICVRPVTTFCRDLCAAPFFLHSPFRKYFIIATQKCCWQIILACVINKIVFQRRLTTRQTNDMKFNIAKHVQKHNHLDSIFNASQLLVALLISLLFSAVFTFCGALNNFVFYSAGSQNFESVVKVLKKLNLGVKF